MGAYGTPVTRYKRPPLVSDFARFDPDQDPAAMLRNERARAAAQGDISEQEYAEFGPRQLNLEEEYRQRGDQLYDELLQNPGLSPEQRERFIREAELQGLLPRAGEFDEQQLTDTERLQMRGDPYQPLAGLNPDQMLEIANQGNRWQQEAIQRSSDLIRPAVYDNALLQDERYGGRQRGTVGTLEGNVREAVDPRQLRLSEGFADRYPMTERDVDALAETGTKVAMRPFEGAYRDVERRVAASGTAAPGALMAYGSRLAGDAAIAGSDAATRARLAADAERRDQIRQAEQMRLDAERGYVDRRTGAEFGLADTRLGAEADIEAGRRSGVTTRAGMIADSERGLLNETNTALRSGNDAIQRAAEFNQGMASGLLADAERQNAERAAAVATNRQNQARYGSEQGFDRGVAVNDRLSGRYGAVADASRADEQEGRGWVTGQQQQAGSRQAEANQQRLQAREIAQRGSMGAATAAADLQIGKKNAPNFLTKNVLPTLNTLASLGR